jgi:hypothetical protein
MVDEREHGEIARELRVIVERDRPRMRGRVAQQDSSSAQSLWPRERV